MDTMRRRVEMDSEACKGFPTVDITAIQSLNFRTGLPLNPSISCWSPAWQARSPTSVLIPWSTSMVKPRWFFRQMVCLLHQSHLSCTSWPRWWKSGGWNRAKANYQGTTLATAKFVISGPDRLIVTQRVVTSGCRFDTSHAVALAGDKAEMSRAWTHMSPWCFVYDS